MHITARITFIPTIEPLTRFCGIARAILTAMPTRLKIKLKSHLMPWIYIKLASNLGGEFTGSGEIALMANSLVAYIPGGEITV